MPSAYIIGGGGHARVIASMLPDGPQPVFVITDAENEDRILDERIEEDRAAAFYLGIGTNADRKRIADKIKARGGRLPACIAPNAFVARDAEVGDGSVVCVGGQIGAGAVIGFACIVNTLSSVDHDCRLGDYSQVTAGVTFGGTVTVGRNCFFGVKSAVIPNTTIGDYVSVMAGAVVTRDLPDRVVAGGSPARVIRRL